MLGVLEVVKAVGSTRQEHKRGPSALGQGAYFSKDEEVILQTICVHLGFCIDFCEEKRLSAMRFTSLNERENSLIEKQNRAKLDIEYERRLVRCVSSIAAWTCRWSGREAEKAMKHGLSAEMAGPDASNKQSLHGFEELFSLVPTTSNTLTDPKLKHVALYIFEEEDRSRPPWTFNRRTRTFSTLAFSELNASLRAKVRVESLFLSIAVCSRAPQDSGWARGRRGSRFSNTDDTSLSLEMLSDVEYRGSHLQKRLGCP